MNKSKWGSSILQVRGKIKEQKAGLAFGPQKLMEMMPVTKWLSNHSLFSYKKPSLCVLWVHVRDW